MPVLNLAKHLKDRGHSITALTFLFDKDTSESDGQSAKEEAEKAGFRVLEAKKPLPSIEQTQIAGFSFEKMNEIQNMFRNLSLQTYHDLNEFYQTEPKPDVIIYEVFVMGGAAIAKQLDVPAAVVIPGLHTHNRHDLLNSPFLMTRYRQVPPIYTRLANAAFNQIIPLLSRFVLAPIIAGLPKTHEWPLDLDGALNEGHLAIAVPVAPVLPPQPMLPSIHNVGPIMHESTSRVEELPTKLKSWLDSAASANESVVYVSFGSMWVPDKEGLLQLTEGLKRLVHTERARVLWARGSTAFIKNGLDLPQVDSDRFLIEDFVPQPAVLAYRALVKAFVSHCGSGSTYESLFNGIPILALPLGADQHMIATRLDEGGLAISMDVGSLLPEEVVRNVRRLTSEDGFSTAVRQQQAILRLAGGAPRATELIEAIGRSGNLKLLRAFDSDWPWYSSASLDLLVAFYFLSVFVFSLVAAFLFFLHRLFLCCCRRNKVAKAKKDQ
eukprot:TRINITY_DN15642_c0_g1_i1.p1 TRINITY_DN15642_c0_g1~~TRINITY_DN15642_c0_g1_i1.p1  ORF type:complete len:553 (+),score=101.96 TRINITY_DN15642_c0_g1_i1:175-1659(+)